MGYLVTDASVAANAHKVVQICQRQVVALQLPAVYGEVQMDQRIFDGIRQRNGSLEGQISVPVVVQIPQTYCAPQH